jgi:hypothetical protein
VSSVIPNNRCTRCTLFHGGFLKTDSRNLSNEGTNERPAGSGLGIGVARPLGGEAAFAIPPVAPVVADEASAIP